MHAALYLDVGEGSFIQSAYDVADPELELLHRIERARRGANIHHQLEGYVQQNVQPNIPTAWAQHETMSTQSLIDNALTRVVPDRTGHDSVQTIVRRLGHAAAGAVAEGGQEGGGAREEGQEGKGGARGEGRHSDDAGSAPRGREA